MKGDLLWVAMLTVDISRFCILDNGARNACWHFLASPPGFVSPAPAPEMLIDISYAQVDNSSRAQNIIIAFHPRVFYGIVIYIFTTGKQGLKIVIVNHHVSTN